MSIFFDHFFFLLCFLLLLPTERILVMLFWSLFVYYLLFSSSLLFLYSCAAGDKSKHPLQVIDIVVIVVAALLILAGALFILRRVCVKVRTMCFLSVFLLCEVGCKALSRTMIILTRCFECPLLHFICLACSLFICSFLLFPHAHTYQLFSSRHRNLGVACPWMESRLPLEWLTTSPANICTTTTNRRSTTGES